MELHQTRRPLADSATAWGWIALGLTILSAAGYALQTILDYVSVPDDVVRLVFYGFFEWAGRYIAALEVHPAYDELYWPVIVIWPVPVVFT